jgi:hypothetical protein
MLSTSVIFIKLPKVNSPPMGGNSPNLVTLIWKNLVRWRISCTYCHLSRQTSLRKVPMVKIGGKMEITF